MISLHLSHISTRPRAYLFFFKNSFSFINFKFLSFAVVKFSCELIPAMGAPLASVDLLHGTHEKAADAHTMASSIWDILNYFASSPWQILTCRAILVADSAKELRK
jgi:hypothetical protein